jgi:hypothetical protein
MAQMGFASVRDMDDWVALAPTRWKLRAAIRAVNQVMTQLRVRQHPDKTSIGRIGRGFDSLGYRLTADGLAVAQKLVVRCVARALVGDEQHVSCGPCRTGATKDSRPLSDLSY